MAAPMSLDVALPVQESPADEAPRPVYRAFGLGFLAGGLACACVAALALSGVDGDGPTPRSGKFVAPALAGPPMLGRQKTAMDAGLFDLFGGKKEEEEQVPAQPARGSMRGTMPVAGGPAPVRRAPVKPGRLGAEEKRAAAEARREEARAAAEMRANAPSTDLIDEEDMLFIKPPLTEEEIMANFIPPPDPYRPAKTEVTQGKGVTVTTIRLGDTFTFPKNGDTVTIDFIGKVRGTQKQFDSTLKDGEPFTFTLGQGTVVPGLEEGILKMSLGESAQMIVTAAAGYGAAGRGKFVPPNSDLVFDVDLFAINGVAAGPTYGAISIGR